jgi:hypothetical protein
MSRQVNVMHVLLGLPDLQVTTPLELTRLVIYVMRITTCQIIFVSNVQMARRIRLEMIVLIAIRLAISVMPTTESRIMSALHAMSGKFHFSLSSISLFKSLSLSLSLSHTHTPHTHTHLGT